MNENKTNINWYPGHMAKTKRQIMEKIDLVDVVILVVDARIPKSSFIPDINDFTKNKEKIIFMSKYDLCDKEETNNWKQYYENEGYRVILSDINSNIIKKEVINAINESMVSVNNKRKERGLLPKKARVMIVGVSNVGKSTLINKLVNKKASAVGNLPGVTKSLSTIKINEDLDLIDTPGVLWPKLENEEVALNLASMTIIKEEVLPLDKVAIYILDKLNKKYKGILKSVFGLSDFDKNDIENEYIKISKYRYIPLLDGEADYDKINLLVVNSIKNETIKGITFD